jgi:hypothetical protein
VTTFKILLLARWKIIMDSYLLSTLVNQKTESSKFDPPNSSKSIVVPWYFVVIRNVLNRYLYFLLSPANVVDLKIVFNYMNINFVAVLFH